MRLRRLLMSGAVCLDIVNTCDHYPAEDEDLFASASVKARGGNVANALAVLCELRSRRREVLASARSAATPDAGDDELHLDLFAVLGGDPEAKFLYDDLAKRGVPMDGCVIREEGRTPTSYIVRNDSNGSRTIVHYRDLAELTVDDLHKTVDLASFDWIHFEGRNISNTLEMIAEIERLRSADGGPRIFLSVEIEKRKPDILAMAAHADLVFVSKDIAQHHKWSSPTATLEAMRAYTKPGAIIVCPWGEKGADFSDADGHLHHVGAFPPARVIDTLGAGDTFVAAFMYCFAHGLSLQEATEFACRLAGAKCGMVGLDGVVDQLLGCAS